MDGNLDCNEIIIKNKRTKNSNSKIFKRIILCLDNKKHLHMLRYTDLDNTEFEVHLVNKKSKCWTPAYISLFIELDSLSPSKKYRETDGSNYEEKCKVRFKSNMIKLKNYFEEINSEKKTTALTVKRYKILKKQSDVPKESKKDKKKYLKSTTEGKLEKVGNCSKELTSYEKEQKNDQAVSHYSCLSQNPCLKMFLLFKEYDECMDIVENSYSRNCENCQNVTINSASNIFSTDVDVNPYSCIGENPITGSDGMKATDKYLKTASDPSLYSASESQGINNFLDDLEDKWLTDYQWLNEEMPNSEPI